MFGDEAREGGLITWKTYLFPILLLVILLYNNSNLPLHKHIIPLAILGFVVWLIVWLLNNGPTVQSW